MGGIAMKRAWRLTGILAFGLVLAHCGRPGADGVEETSPPPGLPTYTAAEYDASTAEVEAAEKQLEAQGLKFDTHRPGVVTWDRDAMLEVMRNEMRVGADTGSVEIGLERKLPALEAYAKVL